jgi:hypothetical protein
MAKLSKGELALLEWYDLATDAELARLVETADGRSAIRKVQAVAIKALASAVAEAVCP